jgi:hypothetical protein
MPLNAGARSPLRHSRNDTTEVGSAGVMRSAFTCASNDAENALQNHSDGSVALCESPLGVARS